jgi:serine/threonine protein kinase
MTVTLGAKDTIEKLKSSKSYIDAFTDLSNWLAEYKQMAKLIHPDICHEPGAKEALAKLNQWKEELEKGKTYSDDAGTVTYKPTVCSIQGNELVLKQSLNNYNKLMSFKERMDIDFQRYIPKSGKLIDNSKLDFNLSNRCIPLSTIGSLPQGHVNWILSRMLEFIGYIHKKGYIHAGINPDSVYVEPINHGINVMSFYHMTEANKKLSTASGKWIYMYPDHIKTKKLGVYVADDSSGLSVKGSSIINFSERNSICKTLRKPETILPDVIKGGKVYLRNVMSTIKSKEKGLTGRLNSDTILLKITN